jgi:hypothetical protein
VLRKCVFVVLVSLILALLCGSVCAAAPTVNLDGSYVSVYGGYVLWGLPYDWTGNDGPFYDWGIAGQIQINYLPTPALRIYAALLCDLGSFCVNYDDSILSWNPWMQDYRFRLSAGVEYAGMVLELYYDNLCTHFVDRYWPIRYEYAITGFMIKINL